MFYWMKIVNQKHITKQMLRFKFFEEKKERVFSNWMDQMDDYFLGGITTPPYGISNRHWNILPQDLRGATEQEMLCYIEGWESARNHAVVNPYDDNRRGELWNRGFWAFNRRGGWGRPPRWVTQDGTAILISDLTSPHIRNILACFRNMGDVTIPNPYQGRSHDEWYRILVDELANRATR